MAIAQSATLDAGTDENSPDMDDLDAAARRGVRARRESMVVVPQTTDEGVCIGIYDVYSESGEDYKVVLDQPKCCDCPDTQYNGAENCKHRRRVALEITEEGCPAPGQEIGNYAATLASHREALREDLETVAGMIEPLAD